MEAENYLTPFYVIVYNLTYSEDSMDREYSLESSSDLFRFSITHAKIQVGSFVGVANGPEVHAAIVVTIDSRFDVLQERFDEFVERFRSHNLPEYSKLLYLSYETVQLEGPVMSEYVERCFISLIHEEINNGWNPWESDEFLPGLSEDNVELFSDESDCIDLTSDSDDEEEEETNKVAVQEEIVDLVNESEDDDEDEDEDEGFVSDYSRKRAFCDCGGEGEGLLQICKKVRFDS